MTTPIPRVGWSLINEEAPSLCRHHVPSFGNHRLGNACWCKPFLQTEHGYTIVMHRESHGADDRWPFAGQLP